MSIYLSVSAIIFIPVSNLRDLSQEDNLNNTFTLICLPSKLGERCKSIEKVLELKRKYLEFHENRLQSIF